MTNFDREYVTKDLDKQDELTSTAVEIAVDIGNIPTSGEFQGYEIDEFDEIRLEDGSAVSIVTMIAVSIKARLAAAYLAGRADQISDDYNQNVQRTIRAKQLSEVVDSANTIRADEDKIDKASILEVFRQQRGAALDKPIYVQTSSSYVTDQIAEYIESGDLIISTNLPVQDELPKDLLHD